MSVISEVKCARCDRKYSGLRSRCPYCGARRIGRGKYSEEADNSKGKMLIGILIMSVLVIAVGVLLVTSRGSDAPDNSASLAATPTPSIPNSDEDIVTVPGTNTVIPIPTLGPTPDDEDQDTKTATVQKVTITYGNKEKSDFTAKVGETVVLRARIEPIGVEEDIEWSSSNPQVFGVVATNTEGTQAKVTGTGKGVATLTVSVGGVEAECIVRVK